MTAFKTKLRQTRPLIGLWQALAHSYSAEICARQGFDWLLLDGEHSPNTLQTMLAQAQAIAPFDVEVIARVPLGEPVVIKQYLDLGLHTLLVPMVDTVEHARAMVRACRYPPHGIRGVSSATSRGANFGADANYLHEACDRITLIVQIESAVRSIGSRYPYDDIEHNEVTLRGNVLPIGGLKEKLLAALRGGIKTVIIPEENVKDLADIPDNVKQGLEIVPVKWIDKVLSIALERQPVPLTDEEVAAQLAAAAGRTPAPAPDAVKH